MIKVGDKVRLIEPHPKYGIGRVDVGEIGTIDIVLGDEVRINFPRHKMWNGLISEVELVTEEESAKVTEPVRHIKYMAELVHPDFTHVRVEILEQSHYKEEFNGSYNNNFSYNGYYIQSIESSYIIKSVSVGRVKEYHCRVKPDADTAAIFELPMGEYHRFRDCVQAYNKKWQSKEENKPEEIFVTGGAVYGGPIELGRFRGVSNSS